MSLKKKSDDSLPAIGDLVPSPNKLARKDVRRIVRSHEERSNDSLNTSDNEVSPGQCEDDYLDLEYKYSEISLPTLSSAEQDNDPIHTGTKPLWIVKDTGEVNQLGVEQDLDNNSFVATENDSSSFQLPCNYMMDPGSQSVNCSVLQTCPSDAAYVEETSELDDLLYHFQNFFQNRVDAEVRHFYQSMSGILQEQQNHVRQIVHTVVRENSSQVCSDDLLYADSAIGSSNNSTSIDVDVNQHMSDLSTAPAATDESAIQDLILDNLTCADTKKQKLLELMSSACSVSTLLAKSQFRT